VNPFSQFFTSTDYLTIIPAVQLALFGCAILLFDAFEDFLFGGPQHRKRLVFGVLAAEVFAGMGLVKQQMHLGPDGLISGFGGSVTVDGFGIFFNWIFIVAAVIVAVVSYKYLEIAGEHHGEYYSLVLFAQSGMYFLATGTDLVTLFIGLELMALCFYVMVGFLRTDKRSNEAAMKYLLLGAFSTGLLVYGFSVMYGLAGSTKLAIIANRLAALPAWDPIVFLAMATTAAGLLFKISAAPFHMWAPDAYEGAPTSVTAYLSVASKAASIAFLVRIFMGPLAASRAAWEPVLAVVAVATLTIGNLAAINQTNIKRLLAYSSISHAGYMLLGLVAGNETGITGIAVYVMVYTFMNLGAFLVLISLRRKNIIGEDLDDIAGLMHKSPRRADADLPALAGRHSAHRRLPGQVLYFPGADPDRPLRAGRHRHALRRGGDLLLLQDCAQHVRGRGDRKGAARHEPRVATGVGRDRLFHPGHRHLPGAVPAAGADFVVAVRRPCRLLREV